MAYTHAMTEAKTPSIAPIRFLDRDMPTYMPDDSQMALLIEASNWFSRERRQVVSLEDLPPGLSDDDPRVIAAKRIAAEGMKRVGRLQTIIGALFVDPDDWEDICHGMAARRIDWRKVAELPAIIMRAHSEAEQAKFGEIAGQLDNRDAKRAAAKKTTTKRAR